MKKNYFMLALASMMMAACANNDLVDDLVKEEVPQAIGFETFAQKATRATENNGMAYVENDLSNHHGTFNVWASKKLADNSYVDVYAANTPGTVTYTTVWTASPLKYWDKAATNYYFYAAAPSEPSWVYTNATATPNDGSTGYLTLANYTLAGTAADNLATGSNTTLTASWKGKTGADKDLMIAAPCPVAKGTYNVSTPPAVNLDFIHILSRLNIAVKATDNNIVIKALDVHKLNNKGSFNENTALSDGELVAGTYKRWGTTSVNGSYTLAGKLGDGLSLVKDATPVYTHEYLIMPQVQTNTQEWKGQGTAPSTDAYIYLEYTVGGETFKTYYGLAQAFGIAKDASLAFNEGWQNTLTLTISPDAIVFTADAAAWGEGSGGSSID